MGCLPWMQVGSVFSYPGLKCRGSLQHSRSGRMEMGEGRGGEEGEEGGGGGGGG